LVAYACRITGGRSAGGYLFSGRTSSLGSSVRRPASSITSLLASHRRPFRGRCWLPGPSARPSPSLRPFAPSTRRTPYRCSRRGGGSVRRRSRAPCGPIPFVSGASGSARRRSAPPSRGRRGRRWRTAKRPRRGGRQSAKRSRSSLWRGRPGRRARESPARACVSCSPSPTRCGAGWHGAICTRGPLARACRRDSRCSANVKMLTSCPVLLFLFCRGPAMRLWCRRKGGESFPERQVGTHPQANPVQTGGAIN
jgi:hypothetical protein